MRTTVTDRQAPAPRQRSRGQVLVIFAGAIFLLMMLMAIVIDVSWYWVNSLRAQRAADAAALAGAVMLPNESTTAYALARREATKNGFTQGQNGVIEVFPQQDTGNPRRLNVRIHTEVGTFFMRVLGLTEIPIVRRSTAEFTLPVPMGSPENYYGVGILNKPTIDIISSTSGWKDAGDESGNWNNADEADDNINNSSSGWALSNVNNNNQSANDPQQQWTEFGLTSNPSAIPDENDLTILGIEFRSRAFLQGSGNTTSGCRMDVQLSWNDGDNWTAIKSSQTPLPTSAPPTSPAGPTVPYNVNLGGAADTWGHTWNFDDLTDTGNESFRVRVTFENSSNCSNTRRLAIDVLEVRVSYRFSDVGPPAPVPVRDPYDAGVLQPQKFWGAMQSQGAPAIQGDAHMAGYWARKGSLNGDYHPVQGYSGSSQEYYNYGVELPGGNGEVWIFDPGFCDTSPQGGLNQGTGESWTVGENLGNNTARPVSSQFVLYNDNNTPYEYGDDPVVASSGSDYRRLMLSDTTLGGGTGGDYPSVSSCTNASWHNDWRRLASGLPAGRYRLHTTNRIYDPTSKAILGGDDQTDSTGLNAFAFWVNSAGAKPRIYGLGAMESYFPLPGNQTSLFYLAQLEAVHADKWVDIDLWDPGDTGDLSAVLSIKRPNGTVAGATQAFFWNAFTGTNLPASFQCGPNINGMTNPVNSITTSTGSGGIFNGRWLRICFKIPADYTAPMDPTYNEPGWWKISYAMSGGGDPATDLTTWKIAVRGNPVHLVLP